MSNETPIKPAAGTVVSKTPYSATTAAVPEPKTAVVIPIIPSAAAKA